MALSSPRVFNAAVVIDAVFTGMMQRNDVHPHDAALHENAQTVQHLIESIDQGLKAAGLTFAEYLERIRATGQDSHRVTDLRWRFSARERAVQRVDSAVTHLCLLMQDACADNHYPIG